MRWKIFVFFNSFNSPLPLPPLRSRSSPAGGHGRRLRGTTTSSSSFFASYPCRNYYSNVLPMRMDIYILLLPHFYLFCCHFPPFIMSPFWNGHLFIYFLLSVPVKVGRESKKIAPREERIGTEEGYSRATARQPPLYYHYLADERLEQLVLN